MFRLRHSFALWFAGSALALAALIAVLAWPQWHRAASQTPTPPSLLIYCAANLRVPLDEIAQDYQRKTGTVIEPHFAGSQTILTDAEVSHRGDLFLPADDSYIEIARQKAMVDQVFPLASMRPVLAVRQGNPQGIHSLDDLVKSDIRFAMANPDAAAIGKITRPVLQQAGWWDRLAAHTRTMMPTVTDVANAIKIDTVDAGIVWDTTVRQTQGLEAIELPVFAQTRGRIAIATLRSSQHAAAAKAFVNYVIAPDGGLAVFKRYGYRQGSE